MGARHGDGDDETVEHAFVSDGTAVVLTDRRLVVEERERTTLDARLDDIRRVELDIERREAVMIIVPERPTHEVQVLTLRPEAIEAAAHLVGRLGQRLGQDPS